jgi:hypothetical protein
MPLALRPPIRRAPLTPAAAAAHGVHALGLALGQAIGPANAPAAVHAQEAPAAEPSRIALEAVLVDPATPAPETLCKLRVRIRNDGEQTLSQLGFSVVINDVELPIYANQLFMYPVTAGETTEIPLYNFWSTESARPAPADGKLRIEVTLREAEWMKIEIEDDVEVWTPLGAVEALPGAATATLTMSGS